ncbi:hypothetical protein SAMN05444673_2823 [Bacillus sp. OV166]|uniref:hypothetical protein n=1 Tax=Bacillus sp. OV166 TaxID=1882763 RepID=UPI000A2AE9F8|nr:hypothetical protein [Bacillus sp. OV166]SMQ77495.1 hypothetical protein SAMN05444673_2823 [Bacillus sp. OV166]
MIFEKVIREIHKHWHWSDIRTESEISDYRRGYEQLKLSQLPLEEQRYQRELKQFIEELNNMSSTTYLAARLSVIRDIEDLIKTETNEKAKKAFGKIVDEFYRLVKDARVSDELMEQARIRASLPPFRKGDYK